MTCLIFVCQLLDPIKSKSTYYFSLNMFFPLQCVTDGVRRGGIQTLVIVMYNIESKIIERQVNDRFPPVMCFSLLCVKGHPQQGIPRKRHTNASRHSYDFICMDE